MDEVAASHLAADGVILFGDTCLIPTQTMPVMYVYTRRECGKERSGGGEKESKVLLLYDVEYQHQLRDIELKGVGLVIG